MRIQMMTIAIIMSCLCISSVYSAETPTAAEEVILKNDVDKTSYALGIQFGTQLKMLGDDFNMDFFILGIKHIFAGKKPAMTQQQIQQRMIAFQQKMREKMKQQQQEQGERNLAQGKVFLEANAKAEGVKVLESGLQYKINKEGTGNKPKATDKVRVHYKGTLINGTEFDSSHKRGQPAEFFLNKVIPGWTEGLQLMQEGSKYQFFIPANLAYGNRAQPNIPANSVLIFEVELLEILPPEPPKKIGGPIAEPDKSGR